MDAIQIELLEEFKYVDAICRDMLSAEKGVSTYIEQMDATPMAVRCRIAAWDDDYRQLKHIRWLRNQIAHSTEYVECTQVDLNWLKAFHNRLLTWQDPLSYAERNMREVQKTQPKKTQTIPTITREFNPDASDSSNKAIKAIIAIAIIAALVVFAGVFIWSMTRWF